MKKRRGRLLLIITLVFLLIFLFFKINLTGNAVYESPVGLSSENCNSATVNQIWDSIFSESSSGVIINISTESYCSFESYKLVGNSLFYLDGLNQSSSNENVFLIRAYIGNLTSDGLANVSARGAYQVIYASNPGPYLLQRNFTLTELNNTYLKLFKTNVGSWQQLSGDLGPLYSFSEVQVLTNETRASQVVGSLNYSFINFVSDNRIQKAICTSNWTLRNESCQTNEKRNFYYHDSNNCGNQTGIPSGNYTSGCDFNDDGFIGNFSGIVTTNINLNISVVNLTVNDDLRHVWLNNSNNTFVEFDWNFTTPLNIENLTLKKESGGSYGYSIVNGLDVTKTIYVDILNSSNAVCIKDATVSSIDQLSTNCNATSEFQLSCPGTSSSISCSIENGRFKISGLAHSAVKEFWGLQNSIGGCLQSWNCSEWSLCENNLQNRTCSDLNFCGNLSGKPIESQSCLASETLAICTPNWNCTSWKPENCTKGNQTRTCTDLNNCNLLEGKPEEIMACNLEKPKSNYLLMIIIIVILVLAVLVAIVYFMFFRKENKEIPPLDTLNKQNPFGGSTISK